MATDLFHPDFSSFKTMLDSYVEQGPSLTAVGEIVRHQQTCYDRQTYRQTIDELALALHALGITPGTKVALLAQTSLRWHLVDLATMMTGAITVPIYPTYLADQVAWHLAHSEASVVIIENSSQWKKFTKAYQSTPALHPFIKTVIFFKDYPGNPTDANSPYSFKMVAWEEVLSLGKNTLQENPLLPEQLYAKVKQEDIASIVYTSGTTGEPKGAILTHHAFLTMLENVWIQLGNGVFGIEDVTFTFLPLSHVLGRCNSLIHLPLGLQNVFATNMGSIVADMSVVRPTLFIAVPRIFELLHEKVLAALETAPAWKQALFQWGNKILEHYCTCIDEQKKIGLNLKIQKRMADNLIFKKVKNIFGGRIKFLVTGGAPIELSLHKFLRHCALPVLEGYGLTETAAPCFLNRVEHPVPGSVGIPMHDVQCKIDPDGEILLKTGSLFSGYYKNEAATKEVWRDGWFATGDIGTMDQWGCLHITDRKKDLIVTSGGKNVAPQMIENKLKTSRYISQAMAIGDNRKYIAALVTLKLEAFKNLQTALCLEDDPTPASLAANESVQKLIYQEIEKVNQHLASFEQVKKFFICPEEFTAEGGHLTPSLKIKRKFVTQRYQSAIESMYTLS